MSRYCTVGPDITTRTVCVERDSPTGLLKPLRAQLPQAHSWSQSTELQEVCQFDVADPGGERVRVRRGHYPEKKVEIRAHLGDDGALVG